MPSKKHQRLEIKLHLTPKARAFLARLMKVGAWQETINRMLLEGAREALKLGPMKRGRKKKGGRTCRRLR
jgi:hypothetical protein